MKRERAVTQRMVQVEVRADDLPAGVCGRVSGIALVYGVVDAYNTRFKVGCLDRTKREKVAAGKVQLFIAEDEAWHQYGTRTHIGVVRSLETVDGSELMKADLFDTESGRRAKEYLEAVTRSGATTGLSIGFFDRKSTMVRDGDDSILEYEEAEMEEVSVTPRPAVPGAAVTGVRTEQTNRASLEAVFDALLQMLPADHIRSRVAAVLDTQQTTQGNANAKDTDASKAGDRDAATEDSRSDTTDTASRSDAAPEFATMEVRLAALRQSYAEAA